MDRLPRSTLSDLSLEKLTIGYDREVLLSGLSICFPSGSFNLLLGSSGGGKTTLLRVIAGLHRPLSGSVRHGQRVLDRVPPHRRDVAMMFQDQALYPHLTVRQNIAAGLSRTAPGHRSRAERTKIVTDWAERMQIESTLDRRPEAISGGQRRRAALAKCLGSGRSILLLDEPLSQLDLPLATEFADVIAAHHQTKAGITICVTHQRQLFESQADQIFQIENQGLNPAEKRLRLDV